jgi:SAM-dependent methyltransferase
VLDYSQSGVDAINKKALELGLANKISTQVHDVRKAFPLADNTFDACYSHMLYCMALTMEELKFLSSEIQRILKTGGLNIYTVRHKDDAHFGQGIHRGEDKVRRLAQGFEITALDKFAEGGLLRKLFKVTLKKV